MAIRGCKLALFYAQRTALPFIFLVTSIAMGITYVASASVVLTELIEISTMNAMNGIFGQ
jgi:hypothetical protein